MDREQCAESHIQTCCSQLQRIGRHGEVERPVQAGHFGADSGFTVGEEGPSSRADSHGSRDVWRRRHVDVYVERDFKILNLKQYRIGPDLCQSRPAEGVDQRQPVAANLEQVDAEQVLRQVG